MPRQSIHYTQTEAADRGSLRVQVESVTGALPIENARVTISYSGDPVSAIEQLSTDASGHAEQVELATPPLEYSMEPDQPQPYAEYNVRVEAEGFQPVDIDGVEVFAGETALQDVRLRPLANVSEPLRDRKSVV